MFKVRIIWLNLNSLRNVGSRNDEEISQILALRFNNIKIVQIAKTKGGSINVMENFIKNGKNYGHKKKSRGNTKLSSLGSWLILRHVSKELTSSSTIQCSVNLNASPRTVQWHLCSSKNLKYVKLKRKPVLSMVHKQARLQFARNHMASRDFWRTVVFSDEKEV